MSCQFPNIVSRLIRNGTKILCCLHVNFFVFVTFLYNNKLMKNFR